LVKKRQRRLEGFDDKVLRLDTRGVSPREMQGHRENPGGTEVSPTLIATITDAVLEDVRPWQARPLATVYPILYGDALFVKSRHDGPGQTQAVYPARGITLGGEKKRLGLWLSASAGGKVLALSLYRAKKSGRPGLLVACVDGLKGLPEALEAVFPHTQVSRCIVHKVRNSLRDVPWTDRRAIYGSATLPAAEQALERCAAR
jgi:transposase-like protein